MSGWDELMGSEIPDPPSSPALCRLYGTLRDLSGKPLRFRNISFRSYVGPRDVSVSERSYFGAKVEAITKRDGSFCIDLPRCVRISVMIQEYMRAPQYMEVPDTDVAALTDYLYPYPVRIEWQEVLDASDPRCPELRPLNQQPPNYEIVGTSGIDVVMVAIYSNSQLYIVPDPDYSADGFTSVEKLSDNFLRLTRNSPGTATLTSLLEENLSPGSTLWERAGFQPTGAPYFLGADSYSLSQPAPLVLDFQ